MKKLLSVLLLSAMLVATLASCDSDSDADSTTTTTAGSSTTTAATTTTVPRSTTTPGDMIDTVPPAETPMEGPDVEQWMEDHADKFLNDKIDRETLYCSGIGIFADGGLANLFDDIYTATEWAAALVVNEETGKSRFDEATYYDKVDMNGSGILGDELPDSDNDGLPQTDKWVELGKFGFSGDTGAFYWSMTEPVTLGSYVIYTGNDNSSFKDRNPVGWKLYGTNDAALGAVPEDAVPYTGVSTLALKDKESLEAAGWTLIDDVYDGAMEDADFLPFGYEIDADKQASYQYYCWFIDYGKEATNLIQCTGMKLYAAD